MQEPFPEEQYIEKEVHLRDYVRTVKKRKYLLFTFFILTMTLVVIYTFTTPPLYEASAALLIEKNKTNPIGAYSYDGRDPEFLETQTHIIKSASVARYVVDNLNLVETFDRFFPEGEKNPSILAAIKAWGMRVFEVTRATIGIAGIDAEDAGGVNSGEAEAEVDPADKITEMIQAGISVKRVRDSKIVKLGFTALNPVLAGMVVNSVAKAYIDKTLEMKMQSSDNTIRWMTDKAEQERIKLEKAERTLQQYMKHNDIITIENRIAITPQKLTEVSSRYTAAQAERKELETLYRKIASMAGNPDEAETIPVINDNPTVKQIRTQIHTAEQHITELSKKYGPKHPVMKRAETELTTLMQKRTETINRAIQMVKNRFELARAKEEDVGGLMAQTKKDAVHMNEKFIQYNMLKREVEAVRQMYDALVGRIKEQDVTENVQNINVWVVEKAKTPMFPASPNKKRNILLGIIVALFGGIGLTFFVEYLDNTIKSPDDAEERFGVPVIGMINFFKDRKKTVETAVQESPRSSIAESFRAMRAALLLSAADHPPKRVLVTSMSPGEGKTTMAANLAVTLANAAHQVLLVDGDLRKPRIHEIFDLDNSKGLATYLAGTSDEKIISNAPHENMGIITAGPTPPNPGELLGSQKMKDLLKVTSEKFDFIIFDSPPLLAASDSLVLSNLLDGTIIVSRAGKTSYEVMNRGLRSLSDVNAHILGMAINAVKVHQNGYYYYSYDQYANYLET